MPYNPEFHGPNRVVGQGWSDKVYAVVDCVPPGHVTTYGDIANELGLRSVARQVGYALAATPKSRKVAWHRVVNSRGMLSFSLDTEQGRRQQRLLTREGVEVDERGHIVGFSRLRFHYDLRP